MEGSHYGLPGTYTSVNLMCGKETGNRYQLINKEYRKDNGEEAAMITCCSSVASPEARKYQTQYSTKAVLHSMIHFIKHLALNRRH